jgi:hypothetical protein
MTLYKAEALNRHAYLLSRFQRTALPKRTGVDWRFEGNLPRATDLRESLNEAMAAEGFSGPATGPTEVSEQQIAEMKFLKSLFVAAAPLYGIINECSEYTYAFGCIKNIRGGADESLESALTSKSGYRPPEVIAGLRLDRDGIYERLHVALRKLADSTVTSAAWNAMHGINGDTRDWLCKMVLAALTARAFSNIDEVIETVKQAVIKNEDCFQNSERMMMHCIFKMFTDNDWAGFLGYCVVWPYEVEAATSVAAKKAA